MNKLWLTYAWIDNSDANIDYVIGELTKAGIDVRFDRRQIIPGQRIWPQLDNAITDPNQVDAWAIFATKNSLNSEACLEELAYALDRALRSRGADFPLIGIFPEPIDRVLMPSALATRLYVNLRDPNWAVQVRNGVTRTRPEPALRQMPPIVSVWHKVRGEPVLEVRPRAGRWHPFVVLVPKAEAHKIAWVNPGAPNRPQKRAYQYGKNVSSQDGDWAGFLSEDAIDALTSAYVFFSSAPTKVAAGSETDLFNVPLAA